MAQLSNSPPSATDRPAVRTSGPMFHESVAKVRVTSAGPQEDYEFAGKTFSRDGEMVAASSLGWDHADLAAAEADPHLVIERFDKNGRPIKKTGKFYPTVGELSPPPAPKKGDE